MEDGQEGVEESLRGIRSTGFFSRSLQRSLRLGIGNAVVAFHRHIQTTLETFPLGGNHERIGLG